MGLHDRTMPVSPENSCLRYEEQKSFLSCRGDLPRKTNAPYLRAESDIDMQLILSAKAHSLEEEEDIDFGRSAWSQY